MQCGMRLVIVVLAVLVVSVVPEGVPTVFTDQFVVQVKGGPKVAKDLAKKHGFTYHAQVSDFFLLFIVINTTGQNYLLYARPNHAQRMIASERITSRQTVR